MSLLDKLGKRCSRFAVPHVTIGLVVGQVFVFAVSKAKPDAVLDLTLVAEAAAAGELWRLVTFLFIPPCANPIFAFFAWYLFFLMGTAPENRWGTFRYNVYLLIAWAATVAVAFVIPAVPFTSAFIGGSVFLAFAFLHPDFELYIFFLLPVKVKWLALITWIGYVYTLIVGPWAMRLLVGASVANFLLFFGGAVFRRMRYGARRMEKRAELFGREGQPFHTCTTCGITNLTHPTMDFRYCTECEGGLCYCSQHIRDHEHVTAGSGADES